MSNQCGIWIDTREAVLIFLDDEGETTVERLPSNVESKTRRRGGSPGVTAGRVGASRGRSSGIQDAMPEDKIDRKYRQELKRYYERVVEAARDRTSIVAFGPGLARDELARAFDRVGGGRHSVWSEPADSMTEAQTVAFVRRFFSPS